MLCGHQGCCQLCILLFVTESFSACSAKWWWGECLNWSADLARHIGSLILGTVTAGQLQVCLRVKIRLVQLRLAVLDCK